MNIRDDEQRKIIESIRKGDKEARDKYILHYYERIKKNLVKLQIPEELHEDILHECIIAVIETIYEADMDNQYFVSQIFHKKIMEQIVKSLGTRYSYARKVNGRIVHSPSIYLRITKPNYNNYDIIREYKEHGVLDEGEIPEFVSDERDTEDRAYNRMLCEKYWSYVNQLPENKQKVVIGRIPIASGYEESRQTIAEHSNCSRSGVYKSEMRIRKKMQKDFKMIKE